VRDKQHALASWVSEPPLVVVLCWRAVLSFDIPFMLYSTDSHALLHRAVLCAVCLAPQVRGSVR
jgi:hypothetical protein